MVSIPKNPFTEERREQLKESAQEFLETFSKEYLKSYGLCLLESILEDEEDNSHLKLQYRDWDDVERPFLFRGKVFFKSGNGPGTWSKWKSAYLVEQNDYKIEIYKSEKDFEGKKKPVNVISPCGYNIARNVSRHYKDVLLEIGDDIGLSDEEMSTLSNLSDYSWAVYHPLRTNYIFQLHESKEPSGCLCLGGGAAVEPDDMGREEAKDRDRTIGFMQRCSNKCQVRDPETIKGKAFDRTVQKMVESFDTLTHFKDNGTEAEILTDMLVKHCIVPLQKPMLDELQQAPGKLKLKLWMKTRGLILNGMVTIVEPAWKQMDKATDAMQQKIEPTIRKGVGKIKEAKEKVKGKVREAVVDKVSEALQKYVSPHLRKVMGTFEKPINDGFMRQKKILMEDLQEVDRLPSDQKKRNLALDQIPRNKQTSHDMELATADIIAALEEVKDLADIFDYIDPEAYRQQTEELLLKVLDGAVYTLEMRIDKDGQKNDIKAEVIMAWEYDSVLQKVEFLKVAVKEIMLGGLKKALAPVVDPVLDPIDETIPEDMHDFLSARGLYEEILDLLIGEPIEAMVEAAYPVPRK